MDLLDKIKEYYPRIDAGDVNWVIDLFADAWRFDTNGLVISRKTYLAAGSDYVKD